MELTPFTISNTSGARAITSAGQYLAIGGGAGDQVRIYNAGPNPVAALCGLGSQTAIFPTDSATANGAGVVIAPGATEVFSMCQGGSMHFICAATQTATVYASRGLGN